jgi:hypothetical protein
MMLGAVATATQVRLIAWFQDCGYHPEPDPAGMIARHGAEVAFEEGWPLCGMIHTRLTGTMS